MDLNSPFDLNTQHNNTDSKITVLLSRLSDFYRQSLWSKAQPLGISPIQVQILLFIKYHEAKLNKVSHLATEFQMTKATISDSVRILVNKGLLKKEVSKEDKRSFNLILTTAAQSLTSEAESFTSGIQETLSSLKVGDKNTLFESLYRLLDQMNESGVIPVQRMCFGCNFYEGDKSTTHRCTFLKKKLNSTEIRIDCEDFKVA